jgi:hypothetical protein
MKKLFLIPILFSYFLSSLARADIIALNTNNASGWILENYAGSTGPAIWNAVPKCANGTAYLYLPNPAPGEFNRLWSIISAAKISGVGIFIRYDNTNCAISSFGYQ